MSRKKKEKGEGTRGLEVLCKGAADESRRVLDITTRAVESSLSGIAITDMDGAIAYVNRAFLGMWGYEKPEEVVGKRAAEFWYSPEQAVGVVSTLRERGGWQGELCARRRDGVPFWVNLSASLVRGDGGEPVCMMASFVDVTERRQAKEELERSEEKFRSLVGNIPNIVVLTDSDGVIQFVNRTVPGYTPGETTGRTIYEFMAPEHHELARRTLSQVLQTGQPGSYEIGGCGPQGRPAWYETQVGPVRRHGEVVGAVLVSTDVSERKAAHEAMRESEAKFRAIFDNASDGILLADVETKKFHTANKAACEMLGYSEGEVRKLGVEDIHPAESLSEVAGHFERQARRESVVAPGLPVKRKDGSIFYADISSSPLDLRGKTYLLGMFRDVTERKAAQDARRRLEMQEAMIEELKEIDRLKAQFVEAVTHELRTPMTPLKSTLEMFLDGTLGEVSAGQRKYLEMMRRNVERLSRFASDVLLFSKVEAGRYELRPHEVSLLAIARPVVELHSGQAREKNAAVSLEIQAEAFAFADPNALSDVLTHLVGNAITHNPPGTSVRICTRPAGRDRVEISVADNGSGIPPEVLDKLFTRFFQPDRRHGPGYRGMGLGLAICRGLAQAMKGEISVESEAGKGTVFRLTLPTSAREETR